RVDAPRGASMIRRAALSCAVIAVLAFSLGPLVSQIVTSLRPEESLFGTAKVSAWSLDNYRRALAGRALGRSLFNSLAVASTTTLLGLSIGSLASFALAKLRFRGKGVWLGSALAISMFPPIATVSALYLFIRALGLRDTLGALILSYMTFALPLTLF